MKKIKLPKNPLDFGKQQNPYIRTRTEQMLQRAPNVKNCCKLNVVNSDYIFNQKEFKKKTKGYDKITGEIEKRGKPQQDEIFLWDGKEPSEAEIKKKKKQLQYDKLEAYNKKLYKERLKSKWDRSW